MRKNSESFITPFKLHQLTETVNQNLNLQLKIDETKHKSNSISTTGNVVSVKCLLNFHSIDNADKNDSQRLRKMNEVEHQNACANIARILSDMVSNSSGKKQKEFVEVFI